MIFRTEILFESYYSCKFSNNFKIIHEYTFYVLESLITIFFKYNINITLH